MRTTTITFDVCAASSVAQFTCPECGKENRKRTFRAECTANPFNKNEDGSVKNRSEVFKQSHEQATSERNRFMRAPLCKACEDAKSYAELKEIRAVRVGSSRTALEQEQT